MNTTRSMIAAAMMTLTLAVGAYAAGDYKTSLQMGDEHRGHQSYELAINEYNAALTQASNDTEESLALSKLSYLYANNLTDYTKAMELARKAIANDKSEPVGVITAKEVLGMSLMKQDRNFKEAVKVFEDAMKLEGVDWAMPGIAMMLGDSYRELGDNRDAVKAYEKVIDMDAAHRSVKATAYFNLGLTYKYNLQDENKGEKAFKEAAKLSGSLKREVERHIGPID